MLALWQSILEELLDVPVKTEDIKKVPLGEADFPLDIADFVYGGNIYMVTTQPLSECAIEHVLDNVSELAYDMFTISIPNAMEQVSEFLNDHENLVAKLLGCTVTQAEVGKKIWNVCVWSKVKTRK